MPQLGSPMEFRHKRDSVTDTTTGTANGSHVTTNGIKNGSKANLVQRVSKTKQELLVLQKQRLTMRYNKQFTELHAEQVRCVDIRFFF